MSGDSNSKPKIVLPFDPRKKRSSDWGEWVYERRTTLMVSLIVYLLFGIAVVSWHISVNSSRYKGVIEIKFDDIDKLEREYQRQIEINRALMAVGGSVRNDISNEAGQLNTSIRDDRGTDARQLYADADAVQERLQANGIEYQRARQAGQHPRPQDNTKGTTEAGETARKAGRVTVSYSLSNPVRSAVKMVTPSYQCEGGGTVTVNIVVNHNGDVVSAAINAELSNSDDCMVRASRTAALSSRFNATTAAPDRQAGTITYIFIPQ